jgi:hypothetical protein
MVTEPAPLARVMPPLPSVRMRASVPELLARKLVAPVVLKVTDLAAGRHSG